VAAHDHQHEHHHGEHFASFTLCFDEAIDWTAFGVWLSLLLHVHGERVLRVKGLLNVPGSASPVVVNGVQHLVHPPYHLARWPDEDQRSRLVFITEGLAREAVAASLATFTALGASFRPPAADSATATVSPRALSCAPTRAAVANSVSRLMAFARG
jgi:G3E family GTPase